MEHVLPNNTEKLLSGSTGDEGYVSLINLNLCNLINHGGKIQPASLQLYTLTVASKSRLDANRRIRQKD
ncbi:hypothetical protein OPV22_027858 [Ensete ventricosum]|uniref:Uncharacterized protein n=1 Tax=Ensete ventricosum TaxID=4639 RepID=A0AAV8Q6Y2_ENSVE|nr:hypothetical protein OPV22_027858 [Ensete ventricosum]